MGSEVDVGSEGSRDDEGSKGIEGFEGPEDADYAGRVMTTLELCCPFTLGFPPRAEFIGWARDKTKDANGWSGRKGVRRSRGRASNV